jgi:hypothetical protein
VAAALAPYAWRELTDRMVARRVVAAVDRYDVLRFLSSVPGIEGGESPPVEPADDGDDRVDALAIVLDGRRWRRWCLDRVCADLVAALDAWHVQREALDRDLRRLLDDR